MNNLFDNELTSNEEAKVYSASPKYRNFYMMLLEVRHDVATGKAKRNKLYLGTYATKHHCQYLISDYIDEVLNAETLTFDISCDIRNRIDERAKLLKDALRKRKAQATQCDIKPQPLDEEECIAFLKERGYKISKKVIRYEEC